MVVGLPYTSALQFGRSRCCIADSVTRIEFVFSPRAL